VFAISYSTRFSTDETNCNRSEGRDEDAPVLVFQYVLSTLLDLPLPLPLFLRFNPSCDCLLIVRFNLVAKETSMEMYPPARSIAVYPSTRLSTRYSTWSDSAFLLLIGAPVPIVLLFGGTWKIKTLSPALADDNAFSIHQGQLHWTRMQPAFGWI
jgi:hypothetical protein